MDSDSASRPQLPADQGSRVRGVVYILSRGSGQLDEYVFQALDGLRTCAQHLTVLALRSLQDDDISKLRGLVDRLAVDIGAAFDPRLYFAETDRMRDDVPGLDEVVLTGDGWFGPIGTFSQALSRSEELEVDLWEMVQSPSGARESFPEEGFPDLSRPFQWTAVRASLFASPAWRRFSEEETSGPGSSSEFSFRARFEREGFRAAALFGAAEFGSHDPGLFSSTALVEADCPLVDIAALSDYPPALSRFATVGRETVEAMTARGYPAAAVWRHLSRTVPPKALNANGGMLEVLPSLSAYYDPSKPLRLAAIVHITDMEGVEDIFLRLGYLPHETDVFVTTTDGMWAARLEPLLESWATRFGHTFELRVTPDSPGRDMSDFFVACRDVLTQGRYDLIFKLHSRYSGDKTVNVRRYFRRYQLENLLDGAGYTENLIGLFQDEPGLGIVFPPMMHIGYATMGKGWAGMRDKALDLCELLGITVPLDIGSPLAPYGGMWVARPEALAVLSEHPWTFSDYSTRMQKKFGRLAHVQERIVVAAAGQRGFHARTVLTSEHTAISHTALEYKVDEMFSTTRGYPVEQIRLLHRAGSTGYGGPVALTRMYLRLNHPGAARALRPLYRFAFRAHAALGWVRRVASRVLGEQGRGRV
ncbi:rhamnan synthesis F family protein [Microbacterium yannicii]|uniref:rhamnan synthesis F family protein n=1 Tax=Microbacterium yannicii TaxID=671622 RepID=UPI0002DE81A1|nr:rhamnan synthesis F family protein [Microbacterium yannicii]